MSTVNDSLRRTADKIRTFRERPQTIQAEHK